MPHLVDDPTTVALLFLAFALALAFEAVNGCHDTSNAVATIIYTRSMKAPLAVVWSGLWNFLGVLLGGTAVAFTFVHLLPVSLLATLDTHLKVALILSPLLAALAWNAATWLRGLPVSSSHSLVGALLGVGLADIWLVDRLHGGVLDWGAIRNVGLALLISPTLGFVFAFVLYRLVARMSRNPLLHDLRPGQRPPMWLRAILTVTCAGVSFTHGSNDGQKTIGLFMLILMALAPAIFSVDVRLGAPELTRAAEAAGRLEDRLRQRPGDDPAVVEAARRLSQTLSEIRSIRDVPPDDRARLRGDLLTVTGAATSRAPASERRQIGEWSRSLLRVTEHVPDWVMVVSAVCLSVGTMVGWKRIVVTVGEKIGKTELTPAQGSSAEVVAMTMISLADFGGMPVSTTHVLSSGVAGTMVARRSGIQPATIRSIALAWILTLPTTMLLAVLFFYVLTRVLA
jgi:PiT family inorganic phosphate transporter